RPRGDDNPVRINHRKEAPVWVRLIIPAVRVWNVSRKRFYHLSANQHSLAQNLNFADAFCHPGIVCRAKGDVVNTLLGMRR
ncbi:MAG TPA: hypothetical protein VN924_22645, partial [Bryobacteraceae bacterium]|nr:hypothetical protein [Bryobacteraceae bacterium]